MKSPAKTHFNSYLQDFAQSQPDLTAFIFLADGEAESERLTYAELDLRARLIATQLQSQCKPGDRALLCYPPGLEFICAFMGCLYAGVIAVPAFPVRNNRHAERLWVMVEDCDASVILSTTEVIEVMRRYERFHDAIYVATEELSAVALSFTPFIASEVTLAFLQYTSGSTGNPKGVMVSHSNILHNVECMEHAFAFTDNRTIVCWLPVQHDMSLVANVLLSIYLGGTCVMMAPTIFLERPLYWLKAISQYGAHYAAAPNFAYELCVKKWQQTSIPELNLSHWRSALNGSEPIRAETLRKFADTFGPTGFALDTFCPGYGMAEVTLLLTGRTERRDPIIRLVSGKALGEGYWQSAEEDSAGSRWLVSSGQVLPEHESVVIVDPQTFNECASERVGEIWIKSKSVAQGYWNKSELTQEIFQAHLSDGRGPYLRTGDLGILYEGELYITGRLKDLIIIQGRNIYPQDIEAAVEGSHAAIRLDCTAVFSVENNGEERIVVVAEIERTARKQDPKTILAAMRKAVIDTAEVVPYSLVLLQPAQALKTTSGKIQRQATKLAYLAGELQILAEDKNIVAESESGSRDYFNLAADLQSLYQKILEIETFNPNDKFSSLGGDSFKATELYDALQRYLGRSLPLSSSVAFDYPSLAELTEYIKSLVKGTPTSTRSTFTEMSLTHEPIAIIGMSCRFPGSESTDDFWELLHAGKTAVGPIPQSRSWLNNYLEKPGYGGFIDNIEYFDAGLFNITPREAERMDPQQRILLETTWEAFESAGIEPRSVSGSATGVFIGAMSSEYKELLLRSDEDVADAYFATGNDISVIAGRVAYTFGLQGPTITIDTACSSSLVAINEACMNLREGKCSLALAGGVNALLSADEYEALTKAQMLSPEGYCKTFDKDADGYARGEGCGVIILKRLSDAVRDKDRILAVIKGSAVNQDGASSGLTVPNGLAQEQLLSQALIDARLAPKDIDYIETHGTGTRLGDPMEVNAINRVYTSSRTENSYLYLGAVKTNIGHLEAAAGIASVIKVILAMQHQTLPPNLYFKELNPQIDLTPIPAQLLLQATEWKKQSEHLRRAGISSFGFSGTNAHIILEEAPEQNASEVKQSLPKTVFDRQRYWASILSYKKIKSTGNAEIHPLLGSALPEIVNFPARVYEQHILLQNESFAYLQDHQVYDHVIFPAAGFIELLLSALKTESSNEVILEKVIIERPLEVHNENNIIQVVVDNTKAMVYSKTMDDWQLNGESLVADTMFFKEPESLAALESRITTDVDINDFYKKMKARGIHYGPAFQVIQSAKLAANEALVYLISPEFDLRYLAYPPLVDGGLQGLGLFFDEEFYMPVGCDYIHWYQSLSSPAVAHINVVQKTAEIIKANINFYANDNCVLMMEGLTLKLANRFAFLSFLTEKTDKLYYVDDWEVYTPEVTNSAQAITIYDARSVETSISMQPMLTLLSHLQNIIQTPVLDSHVYIITENAYGSPINLNQASLNGLLKTAMVEHPELQIRQIDVMKDTDIIPLLEQLKHDAGIESILQYREGQWYTYKILPYRHEALVENIFFDAQARYLITGGLGGIGLVLADFLMQHGVKYLTLSGRHEPSESALAAINTWQSQGVEVNFVACDISIATEVNTLIKKISTLEHPLKGIFHLAGILADAAIDKQNVESFAHVFSTKALGAWNLHEATKELTLDYFVLFSSIASLNGSPGQSNYAAANSFLDALAVYRQQQGLKAESINWGPWREVGMAKDLVTLHERQGIKPLNTDEALAGFEFALKQSRAQLGIMNIDWNILSERYGQKPSWLAQVAITKADSSFMRTLEATPPAEREALLKHTVLQEIKKIKGQVSAVDETKGFFEMGMDSLMALELKNRLQVLLGRPLSNTAAFDYPTPKRLIEYLAQTLNLTELPQLKSNVIQYVNAHEPIAVIGMSCRFPAGANSPEEFWQLLDQGFDAVIDVPKSRWDIDAYYSLDDAAVGKGYARQGAFLSVPVDEFDAQFFKISPREAEMMDPRQRLLLEVCWEALEDARINPPSLEGSLTGVFIGMMNNDYAELLNNVDTVNPQTGVGIGPAVLSGRISYSLGLQGPSEALDTACSSSLVTIHQACQSLREGESDLALAGGVNLMLAPWMHVTCSKAHMLSHDGHCKTFDIAADGYGRGEGCGIIVLKRLSDALRDNDNILAVIRGSAVNQDGASSGLTVPNGPAQEAVIHRALAQAKLEPKDIDYIEAHGTGTSLGDPIEINALAHVFKGRENPLTIGTVKTNISHLEAAAGIAGVIKTILSLQHEKITKHLHFHEHNPQIIDFAEIPAQLPLEPIEWKKQPDKIRRAGVSSFGFSGTNAHVILEEAPAQDKNQMRQPLPKTIFNRRRYWPKVLDEQREKELIFAKDWYVEETWVAQLLVETTDKKVFKHYIWVQGNSTLDAIAASLGAQVIEANALVETVADLENVCVIDAYSYSRFLAEPDVVAETEALMLRYQLWLKVGEKVSRWVMLNGFHGYPASDVLLNSAKVLNWEQASEIQYIGFEHDEIDFVAEIAHGDEAYIVYREDGRYVPRLLQVNMVELLNQTTTFVLDTHGVQLITGGLGGLGFVLLKMLLETGFKQFILVSRHKPDTAQEKEIQELQTTFNADIRHVAVDVSKRAALETLIKSVTNLRGVFHLAGVEVGENFEDYTSLKIQNILQPKMAGAWNLHELTKDLPLKYFVLFSSISSMLGSNRLAPYVLANGYLDSLARYRQAKDLPITSIQWGPWAAVGMATQDERFSRSNRDYIPIDKGMAAFKQLLMLSPVVGLGVVPPEAVRFRLHFHRHLPKWLKTFLPDESNSTSEKTNFIENYYAKPETDRHAFLSSYIEESLRAIMHFAPEQTLDKAQGFFEMGMDSLMSVELYEKIKRDMGNTVTLRTMTVIDYPSLEKLTDYLMQTLTGVAQTIYISSGSYTREPIAVIGLDCRFPAGGEDAESFWLSLVEATDAISYPDALRWDKDMYPYKAGLLKDIDLFDAEFFGISPREAQMIDPQQRLVLETAWHALEGSGIDPISLKGSDTGVFIGISWSDYGQLISDQSDTNDFYQTTGMALNVAAGRLAYTLGLQGPTMAIDTACSSSLVALHEACRSLQEQDCQLAIAGGVNVLLDPHIFALLTQGNMLSPEGYCKTFDKDADGYVRGEGCGLVILKRLSDATRDKDNILAVIKGSAVNQDGASSGLTVPNGLAQEQVLAKALANADVQPNTVDYIETHGTGTSLGDPIEVGAIQTIYGQQREQPLVLGTVKTNIGHLESAAGIAGVIKTILSLQHEMIPKHLHFKEINPAIHLEAIPAKIPLQPTEWKKQTGKIRRAGVSSFGFSGTNAHIILEEAPAQDNNETKPALPKTIFNRQRYWADTLMHNRKLGLRGEEIHPLLGVRWPEFALQHTVIYEQDMNLGAYNLGYLRDHVIFHHIVFPGAGFVELLLAVVKNEEELETIQLKNLTIEKPFEFTRNNKMQVSVEGEQIRAYSQAGAGEWRLHAEGSIGTSPKVPEIEPLASVKVRIQSKVNIANFYQDLHAMGLQYGKYFQTIEQAWKIENELLLELNAFTDDTRYLLYPPILDGALQGLGLLIDKNSIYLPVNFANIYYMHPIRKNAIAHVRITDKNPDGFTADVTIYVDDLACLFIEGFKARKASQTSLEKSLQNYPLQSWCYEQVWESYSPIVENTPHEQSIVHDARSLKEPISVASAQQLLAFVQKTLQENRELFRLNIITENAYVLQQEMPNLNHASLTGFIKTLILEHPTLPIRHIDVGIGDDVAGLLANIDNDRSFEQILVHRAEKWFVPRIMPIKGLFVPSDEYRLNKSDNGVLEDMTIIPEERFKPAPDEIIILPSAVGLNFRDVLNAMNLYPGDPGPLGSDVAGVVLAIGANVKRFKVGDAVFGLAKKGLSSQAVSQETLLIHKLENLSFAQASATPTVFMTAYLALIQLAKLTAGETVLIHAGTGGVGLAAIQIAQYLKARVIVTAGNETKREYLKSLGVEAVFNSRNTDFEKDILRLTDNHGVDVVLNSLTGKGYIEASLRCCAPGARFIEIGKRDIWSTQEVAQFRNDIAYHILALDTIAQEHSEEIQKLLSAVIELFKQGFLQPLPLTEFSLEQAVAAFNYLKNAQQIGKVIINLPSKQMSFDKNGSYLITGGLGGIGLALAQYLSEHGAGRIILSSRRTVDENTLALIATMKQVEIKTADVSAEEQVKHLIQFCHTDAYPLKGIFHLAGIIEDAPIEKQTLISFENVFNAKALSAWYLHEATKAMDLNYFVMFSSIASLNGSPGQSNYAAANSLLDGLAYYRRHQGLTAQTINWGPWREVGMAKSLVASHERQGIIPLSTAEGLAALSHMLSASNRMQMEIVHAQWKKVSESLAQVPSWLSYLLNKETNSAFLAKLDSVEPEQKVALLLEAIEQEVRAVLALPSTKKLDINKGFFEIGMDSLIALELKNRLQAFLGVILPNTLIFDYPTLRTLNNFLINLTSKDKTAKDMDKISENKTNEVKENILKMTDEDARSKLEAILQQMNPERKKDE